MIFVHQAANSPQCGAPKRYKLVYNPHDLRTINHSYWMLLEIHQLNYLGSKFTKHSSFHPAIAAPLGRASQIRLGFASTSATKSI